MNQDERITYAVALKAAAELLAADSTFDHIGANVLLTFADEIYAGILERHGTTPPQEVAARPIPAASVVPSTDPGQRFQVGDQCPKCKAASLILKTNQDGSKAWLQCADKKVKKVGNQWQEAGACTFGPYDESYAFEVRQSLWMT